jgi:hypothetical protein
MGENLCLATLRIQKFRIHDLVGKPLKRAAHRESEKHEARNTKQEECEASNMFHRVN